MRVDGKKIAGILVERSAARCSASVVNANVDASALPPEVRDGATSLHAPARHHRRPIRTCPRVDPADWMLSTTIPSARGASVLRPPWRQRTEHLGAAVVVTTPSGPIAGRLDDLDLCRGLALTGPDGGKIHVPARQISRSSPGRPSRDRDEFSWNSARGRLNLGGSCDRHGLPCNLHERSL